MSDQLEPQYAADLHRQGEVQSAEIPPRKPRKWIGRVIGLCFVGALVGAAVIVLIRFVNDPVSAKVTQKSLIASIQPTPTPPGHLGGLYITMDYPGVFNQVSQVKTDSLALEQYTLTSSSSYRRTITVDVKSLPSGNLKDDADYSLRSLEPDTYTPSTVDVSNQAVTEMTKSDGSEITLFWPHAGKLLVLAVTTSEPGDHPATFMSEILPSIRWNS